MILISRCDALNIQAMEKELSETADNTNIQPPDDTTVHPNPVQLHYIINGRKTGVIHFDAADRIIFVDDLYSDDVMKEVWQKIDKHLMPLPLVDKNAGYNMKWR